MVTYSENIIRIGARKIRLSKPIIDAKVIEDFILVIHDYMEYPKHGTAANLVCLDMDGQEKWLAKNPTNQSADAYTNFYETSEPISDSIFVHKFIGCVCKIDLATGDIAEVKYTK